MNFSGDNPPREKAIRHLSQRVLALSFKYGLTHIGSCLNAIPILYDIYEEITDDDKVILSQGHAGLALYVILENRYSIKRGYYGIDAEVLIKKHGTHPSTDLKNGICCSTGSLGHGLGIGVGMAIANKDRDVYVVISDGECAEGSIFEALTIARNLRLDNLKVYLNANGYSAYDEVDLDYLIKRLNAFEFPIKVYKTKHTDLLFLSGLEAHYHKLTSEEYFQAVEKLSK